MSGKCLPWGRWNKGQGKGRGRALTYSVAVFEYTEELVIVTVPPMMYSPPPCTHRSNGHSIGALKSGTEGQEAHTPFAELLYTSHEVRVTVPPPMERAPPCERSARIRKCQEMSSMGAMKRGKNIPGTSGYSHTANRHK